MKITKSILIFFISGLISFNVVYAQSGNTGIKTNAKIDSLIYLHKEYNKKFQVIPGYRIQIFKESGNKALEEAQKTVEEFYNEFPDIPAYLSFQEPFYRIRAGNFKTRLDALGQLEQIKKEFKNAWVISEYIYFSDSVALENSFKPNITQDE